MPTYQVESIHEAEPDHPVPDPTRPGVESPGGEAMQGAPGAVHAEPDPATAGPGTPDPAAPSQDTNADDVTPGDQDIDTAGTEHDEESARHGALELPKSDDKKPDQRQAEAPRQLDREDESMAHEDPDQDRHDRNVEEPGDTNAADIVGRTGEQMPRKSHDGLEEDEPDARSTHVNDEEPEQRPANRDTSAGRHDNPRTGRVSDW